MPGSALSQELKQPKLLDQVRQYLRLHHYSIHTERSYVDWIVRFIRFHRMHLRDDLSTGEPKIEVFLTHLAVEVNVAPAKNIHQHDMAQGASEVYLHNYRM